MVNNTPYKTKWTPCIIAEISKSIIKATPGKWASCSNRYLYHFGIPWLALLGIYIPVSRIIRKCIQNEILTILVWIEQTNGGEKPN